MVESISKCLKQKFLNLSKDLSHINVDFFEFSLSFSIREFVGYTAFSWRVEVSRECRVLSLRHVVHSGSL